VQDNENQEPSSSFPPIARPDARILILGSLPGQRSLREQQYYAHPQNAFWRIMAELVGAEGDYEQRCESLMAARIALWDVLAESVRPGSMDSDIRLETAKSNDFAGLFGNCPRIGRVCFNGRKAAAMFERFVGLETFDKQFATLPSTSPAYASMPYTEKLERWRSALE
jgi:TDG/mug DNA glycosylase family protein